MANGFALIQASFTLYRIEVATKHFIGYVRTESASAGHDLDESYQLADASSEAIA